MLFKSASAQIIAGILCICAAFAIAIYEKPKGVRTISTNELYEELINIRTELRLIQNQLNIKRDEEMFKRLNVDINKIRGKSK